MSREIDALFRREPTTAPTWRPFFYLASPMPSLLCFAKFYGADDAVLVGIALALVLPIVGIVMIGRQFARREPGRVVAATAAATVLSAVPLAMLVFALSQFRGGIP